MAEASLWARHIFLLLSSHFLGVLSFTIAAIHVYKYFCKRDDLCPPLKRPSYLVRALNWLVFGTALILFPHMSLTGGRALLRVALAFMIFSELGYNLGYLGDLLKDTQKALPEIPGMFWAAIRKMITWTRELLRL